jgi:SulP family sulfate permease
VTDNTRVIRQLRVTGAAAAIGSQNVYRGTAFLGATVRQAYDDALAWIDARESNESATSGEGGHG